MILTSLAEPNGRIHTSTYHRIPARRTSEASLGIALALATHCVVSERNISEDFWVLVQYRVDETQRSLASIQPLLDNTIE
jgi:hypothetical protein